MSINSPAPARSTANIAADISESCRRARETYTTDDAHEITQDVYYEALEVLPPVYGDATETQIGRFWMGEPYTHSNRGIPVCLECWEERGSGFRSNVGSGRYFCRLSECPNFR